MVSRLMARGRHFRQKPAIWVYAGLLLLLIAWYLAATLPYLADYPKVDAAQMGIAAPAAKLASSGVYGNDLYTGFYHNETRNYEYMPLYPLTVALAYWLGDINVGTGRLVSVLCGLVALLLTVGLGARLHGPAVGLLAGWTLCALALAVPTPAIGDLYPGAIPFLDLARVLRYDIMVPVWVLASALVFFHTYVSGARGGYALAGFLAGLATLSQPIGVFILAVFAVFLLWEWGRPAWRRPAGYLLMAGWLLALLPWAVYIAQDPAAFAGQQLRHQSRLDLLNPLFYVNNLALEPWRYVKFFGAFRPPLLWPRPGLWLALFALGAANVALFKKIRQSGATAASATAASAAAAGAAAEKFTWLSLAVLVLSLALLVSFKRYAYIVLILPFLSLQIAYGVRVLWRAAAGRRWLWRAALLCLLAAAFAEGMLAIGDNLQAASRITPYQETGRIAREIIPPNARVLAMHGYYLTLYPRPVQAIDLAFSLADPAFGLVETPDLPQTLQNLQPEYIVVPAFLLYAYRENPAGLPGEKAIRQWRELDTFVQANCRPAASGPADPDYGQTLVFDCTGTGG